MFLLIALLMQFGFPPVEPPPTPEPVVVGDPCENMTPYDGGIVNTWILPTGEDCTPDESPIIEGNPYAPPPPPIADASTPEVQTIVNSQAMRVRGFRFVSRAGELK